MFYVLESSFYLNVHQTIDIYVTSDKRASFIQGCSMSCAVTWVG